MTFKGLFQSKPFNDSYQKVSSYIPSFSLKLQLQNQRGYQHLIAFLCWMHRQIQTPRRNVETAGIKFLKIICGFHTDPELLRRDGSALENALNVKAVL